MVLTEELVITAEKVVSITYELRSGSFDGKIVEVVDSHQPLTFISGMGSMLEKFEEKLEGLHVGDTFKFKLAAADAYGDVVEENIIELPISAFHVNGKLNTDLLQVGNVVPMQDKQGNRYTGVVRKFDDKNVTLDFNHPMAGQDLYFQGEVIEVRDATDEELAHGHVHGMDSCGSGGCGSGSCGCH